MKPTVKILLVLLAALTAQTASAQEFNVCPLGGIIYQHGNIIWRDSDGDVSEQEAEDFLRNGFRFRVDRAHLVGAYSETGRYRMVTIKVVFGSPRNAGRTAGVSWVREFAIPHEQGFMAYAGAGRTEYRLENLGSNFQLARIWGRVMELAAPRMIYTGDVCFYEAEQPQR